MCIVWFHVSYDRRRFEVRRSMLIVPDPNCQGKLTVRNEHWVSAVGTSRLPLSSQRSASFFNMDRICSACISSGTGSRWANPCFRQTSHIDSHLSKALAFDSGTERISESATNDIAMAKPTPLRRSATSVGYELAVSNVCIGEAVVPAYQLGIVTATSSFGRAWFEH